MTSLQLSNPDVYHFIELYKNMINNIVAISYNSDEYVFYVSNGRIVHSSILFYFTIDDERIKYYYNINEFRDTTYNVVVPSILIYDTKFDSQGIYDLSNTDTDIPSSILELNHYYLWDGSHLNIAPIIQDQRINYHYTNYIINPRYHNVSIRRKFCKFTVPEWILNRRTTQCYNEIPPKIFDQIQGRTLSSLDSEFILNTMLNLPLPQEMQLGGGKITDKFHSIKPFTDKLSLIKLVKNKEKSTKTKKELYLDTFKKGICKYVAELAKKKDLKLVNDSVIICNPFKQNNYGMVILNVGIMNSKLKDTTHEEIKGYYKTTFRTKEITQFIK